MLIPLNLKYNTIHSEINYIKYEDKKNHSIKPNLKHNPKKNHKSKIKTSQYPTGEKLPSHLDPPILSNF